MALYDRVRAVTSTSGTGPITPGAAVSGYRSFAAAVPDGATVSYVIEEGEAWEIGTGLYDSGPNTLTRTVIRSSLGLATALSLTGGAQVFLSPNAADFAAGEGLAEIAALSPSNDDLLQRKAGAWTNRTVMQFKTDLALAVGDISDIGESVVTFLATPSSSNLALAVSDETGSGALVFATSPTIAIPAITTNATISNSADGPASYLLLNSLDGGFSVDQEIRIDFQQTGVNFARIAGYFSGGGSWGMKFYGGAPLNVAPTMTITGADRVGIGTPTPVSRLTIKATTDNTIPVTILSAAGLTKHEFGVDSASDGNIGLYDAASARTVLITSAGDSWLNGGKVGIGNPTPAVKLDVDGPIKVKSYTMATVPAASAGAGQVIYVSNEAGGGVLAFSDNTDWRRVTDRAVIS